MYAWLICFDEPHPFVLQRTARADDRVLVQSVGVEGRRQPAPGSEDKTGCLSSCWQGSLASKASISVIIPRMEVKFPVSHLSWVSLTLCRSTVTSLMDLLNAEGQGELLVF